MSKFSPLVRNFCYIFKNNENYLDSASRLALVCVLKAAVLHTAFRCSCSERKVYRCNTHVKAHTQTYMYVFGCLTLPRVWRQTYVRDEIAASHVRQILRICGKYLRQMPQNKSATRQRRWHICPWVGLYARACLCMHIGSHKSQQQCMCHTVATNVAKTSAKR